MSTEKTKSKRKPGRPPKLKGEGKEIIKSIRFRKDELKLYEKEAEKNNQKLSEWVRQMLREKI